MLNITEDKFLKEPKEVLKQMQSANEMVNVMSDEGGYVIIDSTEWQSIYETLYINSIPGLTESIIESSKEPLDTATPLEELDW
jgi:antitoxin YefM